MSCDDILVEVRELFLRRSEEVDRYFKFLSDVAGIRANAISRVDGDGTEVVPEAISRELIKTLRANGYLLLYNLVEATMTNAIDGIHRCYILDGCDFDALSNELRRMALENFKKTIGNGSDAVINSEHPIQRSITRLGYDKEKLFSGNLDAKEIRKTAGRYGFAIAAHDTSESRDGRRLKSVKDRRNSLAHGKVSFEDCGHDTSLDELLEISRETKVYLDAVLRGIETYVKAKSYKASA